MTNNPIPLDDAERARFQYTDDYHQSIASMAAHRIALEEAYRKILKNLRATIEQNKYPYKMPTNFERWMK